MTQPAWIEWTSRGLAVAGATAVTFATFGLGAPVAWAVVAGTWGGAVAGGAIGGGISSARGGEFWDGAGIGADVGSLAGAFAGPTLLRSSTLLRHIAIPKGLTSFPALASPASKAERALLANIIREARSESFARNALAAGFSHEHIRQVSRRLLTYRAIPGLTGGSATADTIRIGRIPLLGTKSMIIRHELGHILDDVARPGIFSASERGGISRLFYNSYGFRNFYRAERVAYLMQYGRNPVPLTAINAAAQVSPATAYGAVGGLVTWAFYNIWQVAD